MEIEFRSNEHCLCHIDEYLNFLLLDVNQTDVLMSKIRICVYEGITNAVKHGNQFDPDKLIQMKSTYDKNRFVIEIIDQGHGFDLDSIANPHDEQNLRKASGRGLFFIQENCDTLVYDLELKGLIMTWKLG